MDDNNEARSDQGQELKNRYPSPRIFRFYCTGTATRLSISGARMGEKPSPGEENGEEQGCRRKEDAAAPASPLFSSSQCLVEHAPSGFLTP